MRLVCMYPPAALSFFSTRSAACIARDSFRDWALSGGGSRRTHTTICYLPVHSEAYVLYRTFDGNELWAVVAKFLGGVFCWFLESWHPGVLAGCTEPPRRVISCLCLDVGVNRR